jgi:hypothetical protein
VVCKNRLRGFAYEIVGLCTVESSVFAAQIYLAREPAEVWAGDFRIWHPSRREALPKSAAFLMPFVFFARMRSALPEGTREDPQRPRRATKPNNKEPFCSAGEWLKRPSNYSTL